MKEFPNITFDLTWRPFQLNPDMPSDGIERKKYLDLKFNGEENAKKIYDNIYNAGKEYGIHFQFNKITKTPNSFASHKLLALAYKYQKQSEVVEALFYEYFIEGVDIGNFNELIRISKQHKIFDTSVLNYLKSTDDNENLKNEEQHARHLGINAVPCFIINKEFVLMGAQDKKSFSDIFMKISNVD